MGKKGQHTYTDGELLDIIKAKADELGRTPRYLDVPQAKTIIRRFGSWNNALERIGVIANRPKYTEEEAVEIIRAKQREYAKRTGYAAEKRSNKKNSKLETIRLSYSTDGDILKKLESIENKSGYIKKLIREDILKNN